MHRPRLRAPRPLRGPRRARARAGLTIAWVALVASACTQPSHDGPATDLESAPASADRADLPAFVASLPEVVVPALDREMALTLLAMPLSCLDHPHAPPEDRRSYLDTLVATRLPGYEQNRAFYGCWDWHSAVNSTWAMVRLYKEFPDIAISGLIEEKLDDHLSEKALEGEVAFFEEEESFERPYGWAWLLELDAELRTWDHPDAAEWSAHVAPLAGLFSTRMVEYLEDLKVPSRVGVHGNTAFALAMMLDAARDVGDDTLEQAIERAAQRLYSEDFGCPTAYEPWGSDFLSPCLEEAALMSAVLGPHEFVTWLAAFLPPVTSREFRPLTRPTDPEDVVALESTPSDGARSPTRAAGSETPASSDDREADAQRRFLASKSHLIGLAFIRADALNRIVRALPADDPRIQALRGVARLHGARGFEAMFDASYAGSHWIGTFALKYLLSERHAEPPVDPAIALGS